MPINKGNNKALDCAVIKFARQSRKESGKDPYDVIRGAFAEGKKVYKGATLTSRHHIQICVINPDLIKGYFLPRPIDSFNPYMKTDFVMDKKASKKLKTTKKKG